MKTLYWIRSFIRIIYVIRTVEKAKKMGLRLSRSIHGDEINATNARTIWKDKFENIYFCKE